MTLYVLDTDISGFLQQGHPAVVIRIRALPGEDSLATTIITFGEDLGGWLPACRRAPDGATRAQAYGRLQKGLEFYREINCLPFDEIAATVFDRLRAQHKRVGTNDLAIAAITLAVGGVLVSRNIVDFQRIPNLDCEDWAT